ncbi:hypothetical protein BDD12DRAFT_877280 [Trichophaea hybrida]|nr:hypothetical protein BDD12DRAFT_877280 [Trichophaea hybrida]
MKSTKAVAQTKKDKVKDVIETEFSWKNQEQIDGEKHLMVQCRTERSRAQPEAMKEDYDKVISNGCDFDIDKIHVHVNCVETVQAIMNLPLYRSNCSEKCYKTIQKDMVPNCNYI